MRIFAVLYALSISALLTFSAAAHANLPEFTELVAKNSPAVVNISTQQKVTASNLQSLPGEREFNEFLRKFFEGHGGELPPDAFGAPEAPGELDERSLGSGFVISPDGYVLTNRHVIKDADEIIVRFSDRKEYRASVVGADTRTDVALLKIDAEGLPTLTLGNSSSLKVGEWVLAIGSPFGFDHSATAGIVSAKRRSLPSEQYVAFIQTDVAINPGNSGGPLFNLKGEVVGVNSQIYSRTGGFMGLSFAIPIEVAVDVAEQLKSKGKVTRGWLGVYIQEVTGELAESFGMRTPRGALVAQVIEGSPAQKGKIQVGDVILSFNGQVIKHSSDLPPLVGLSSINEPASVALLRNGKEVKLDILIEPLPDEDELDARRQGELVTPPDDEVADDSNTQFGLTLAPLDDETRKDLGIDHGVMVKQVVSGPFSSAGVRAGDVIAMVDGRPIKSIKKLLTVLDSLPNDQSVPMLVYREDGPVFIPLKLSSER